MNIRPRPPIIEPAAPLVVAIFKFNDLCQSVGSYDNKTVIANFPTKVEGPLLETSK